MHETVWKYYGYARKESSWITQKFITKWLSGYTSIGRVMVQRKQRLSSNYPRCNTADEHIMHVLTCIYYHVIDLRSILFKKTEYMDM